MASPDQDIEKIREEVRKSLSGATSEAVDALNKVQDKLLKAIQVLREKNVDLKSAATLQSNLTNAAKTVQNTQNTVEAELKTGPRPGRK